MYFLCSPFLLDISPSFTQKERLSISGYTWVCVCVPSDGDDEDDVSTCVWKSKKESENNGDEKKEMRGSLSRQNDINSDRHLSMCISGTCMWAVLSFTSPCFRADGASHV